MSLKNLLSLIAFSSGFIATDLGQPTFAQDCSISTDEEVHLLGLPYQEFDQSLGGGWRAYGDRGCYQIASRVLDSYRAMHQDSMLDWQVRVLTWHAGQMYAFGDNYGLAKVRFLGSCDAHEAADTLLLWNDYVSATLAFLDHDVARLSFHSDRIAHGPVWNGEKGNLSVVNALLNCIGRPYAVAYTDPGCRNSSGGRH